MCGYKTLNISDLIDRTTGHAPHHELTLNKQDVKEVFTEVNKQDVKEVFTEVNKQDVKEVFTEVNKQDVKKYSLKSINKI